MDDDWDEPVTGFGQGRMVGKGRGFGSGGFGSGDSSSGFGQSRDSGGFGQNRDSGGFGQNKNSGGFGSSGFGGQDRGSGGGGGRACFKCGEEGHMSRECPSAGSGGGGGSRACFKCGEEGHMSRECPKGGGGGGGNRACFKCGEEGHMSRECPSGGGGGSGGFGSRGGFGQNKSDNQSSGFGSKGGFGQNNSQGQSNGFGGFGSGGDRPKGCYKCGEEGHTSRDCPNNDSAGGGGGSRGGFGGGDGDKKGCFNCGESGHFSRECPNPKKEPQDGEKKHEIYIPPENDEDATFGDGIDMGINFDKYKRIPVKVSGDDPVHPIDSFETSNLRSLLIDNIGKAKYTTPTPIQKHAIPIAMANRDLMACAQTGSGKTAAFLLPIINRILQDGVDSGAMSEVQEPNALIVTPTRELTTQIYNECRKFAQGSIVKVTQLYGGTSTQHQSRKLEAGCHVLVGTPGRLLDFLEKNKFSLAKIKFVVLDEADRMLDMGFLPEMKRIFNNPSIPPMEERQTLMFSATFPNEVQLLAKSFLKPSYLFIGVGIVGGANDDVKQEFYLVPKFEKREKLRECLGEVGKEKTMVFVETKRTADFIAAYMSQNGFPTTSIHGDRLQREREEALRDFKSGRMPIIVATAVAARGLDIKEVAHVINYDMPKSSDEFVHRIGRTGRVGNVGHAISFFDGENDREIAPSIVKMLSDAQQDVPDWLADIAKNSAPSYGGGSSTYGGQDMRQQKYGGGGGGAVEEDEEWD